MTCNTLKSITKIQWDTYTRSFVFKNASWTAINLTGSIIKFSVKSSVSDSAYVAQETLTLTDAVNGTASLSIDLTMAVWNYVYDFEWTDAGGKKETLEMGKLTIINWVS